MRDKFRLAQLLKYRKSIEDQKRITVATIEEKRYRAEEELSRLREDQRLCYERLQEHRKDTHLLIMSLDSSARQSVEQRKSIKELEQQILNAKEELLEASKSRKVVEKLKDRHQKRLKQKILKHERKYLDEVASIRNLRRKTASSTNNSFI